MNIRFYNAKIMTMAAFGEILEGELWTQDDQICYVGKSENAPKDGITFDREIDAKGNLLMPGFKNAHTHSGMTFLRSFADDLPLDAWLNTQVFPAEAKLCAEDIYHLTKLANLEYLTSGVTAIFDMYLTPESIADACRDTGMRCVQVGAVNNFSQSVDLVEDMYKKLNGRDPYNSFILGFHAEYTCSRELLEQIASLAKKYKAPVFTHNSETSFEVEGCKERYGMTPTQLFEELGIYDFGGGGYHCVHLEEPDFEIFKRRGLYVVTNPASNAKLASGIAPIYRFLQEGIPVAIGTDGPASNNCLDMFREMFLVTSLAKLREMDAAVVDGLDVLTMATVNGAKAMGLNSCLTLEAGQKADLIMIDLNMPNMQPINNIAKNIVYSGSKSNVMLTMIDGIIRFEKGEFFVGTDVDEIYCKANEITQRIKNSLKM